MDEPGQDPTGQQQQQQHPLFTNLLSEAQVADDLVVWGGDCYGSRKVVALRELRLAAVLFAADGANNVDRSTLSQSQSSDLLRSAYIEELFVNDGLSSDLVVKDQESQVSLLDLALRFGHYDIACALNHHGIQCHALTLMDLETQAVHDTIDDDEGDQVWYSNWKRKGGEWTREVWFRPYGMLEWEWLPKQSQQPGRCLWNLHEGQDLWAADWSSPLHVAQARVDTPTTRLALLAAADGRIDMLQLGSEAQLRLLDAALLLGQVEASAVLAELCGQARPLRICATSEIVKIKHTRINLGPLTIEMRDLASTQYVEAHLKAGAIANAKDLLKLVVLNGHVNLAKLIQVIDPAAYFGLNMVSSVGNHLTYDTTTHSIQLNRAALEAMNVLGMKFDRLMLAFDAWSQDFDVFHHLDFHHLDCQRCESDDHANQILEVGATSLLYFAIYLGDRCGVSTLVSGGADLAGEVEVSALLNENLLNRDFLPEIFPGPCCPESAYASERSEPPRNIPPAVRVETVEFALSAALPQACERARRVALTVARVGLWQLICSNLKTVLVDLILDFAAELPQGLQCLHSHFFALIGRNPLAVSSSQLPSNRHVSAATPTPEASTPTGPQASPASPAARTVDLNREPGKDDDAQGLEAAMRESEAEALAKEQQDVHKALLLSKEAAFNGDHVVLWRLTNCSKQISHILQTSDELRACHDRVQEAGCELTPAWAGGALLLVPLTLEHYTELNLKFDPHHVLSLSSDRERLEAALMAVPYRKRPDVRSDHRAAWLHEEDAVGGVHGEDAAEEHQQEPEQSDQESDEENAEADDAAQHVGAGQPERHHKIRLEIVHTFFGFRLLRDESEASSSGLARSAPEAFTGRGSESQGGLHVANPRRYVLFSESGREF
ncbi:unnamed protein product [Polarella glacialis]|uniref:Uncharacterized protein n=1 Tax=Polarella glacialis TaxID=89957 RepID=A0A813GL16_POLGL|nr:unnamed protein product [Polarella glacialis]CAE8687427.1 unnamed protein product [Polarella glacialis]